MAARRERIHEASLDPTGDAGEGLEIYYAIFRLKEEGHAVEVAAPTAKPVQAVLHDFEPGLIRTSSGRGIVRDLGFRKLEIVWHL